MPPRPTHPTNIIQSPPHPPGRAWLDGWSLQVYELFNRVLILSQGETVYFGGTKDVVHWFDTALHRWVGEPQP